MDNYDLILQTLLETLIQVLLPVLLTVAIAWLKQQYSLVKARIPAEQLEFAAELARQFVMAAEQSGLAGHIKDEAAVKKEWVLYRLESELDKRGIKLDVHTLSDLVESAVFDALNQWKVE